MAFVKHPIYGVLSYMLVFYFSPGQSWWSAEVPNLPWALLTAGVAMTACLLRAPQSGRLAWYRTTPARWLILFTVWLWIQSLWALSPEDHFFLAALFTKYVILYATLYCSLSDLKHVRYFVLAHILGSFFWGYTAYQNPGSGRLENLGFGDIAGSAFASMHMGTALAFAGFAVLGTSWLLRAASVLSAPFVVNAIVLMATRGAFVGLLGGALVAPLLAPAAKRRLTMVYLALGAVLLIMLAHDIFWSRMSTILPSEHVDIDQSSGSRLEIAKANFEMFLDYPMGAGHRGNDYLSTHYMPDTVLTELDGVPLRAAHNTVMAVLVDHGVVGIVFFVLFHMAIARRIVSVRYRSSPDLDPQFATFAAALGTAMVIYWLNAQFVNVTKAEVVIWIAVLASALQSLAVTGAKADQTPTELANTQDLHLADGVRSPSAE